MQRAESYPSATLEVRFSLPHTLYPGMSHTQTHWHQNTRLFPHPINTNIDPGANTEKIKKSHATYVTSAPSIHRLYPPVSLYCSPLAHLLYIYIITAARTLKMRTHSKHFSLYYPTQALTHYRHTGKHLHSKRPKPDYIRLNFITSAEKQTSTIL